MADNQRIHPVDVESQQRQQQQRASAPLVPRESSRSEKGDPAELQPPPPAPLRRTLPVVFSPPPKRRRSGRSCCCRCICWTVAVVVILVLLIAATLAALYFIFDPKLPKYSVDRLSITAFSVDASLTARASFDVTVTAENPNKAIGIYYDSGSRLGVYYSGYSLSEGSWPAFYQGHENTTVVAVAMSGQAQLGSAEMGALQQQQQTGAVPIDFRGDVPVRLKLGGLRLWKVTSRVRCSLVVDSLTASSQIRIKSSSCKFRLKV